jgi:2-oxoglutarate dehydrogenase E2 component (dihydrolipoamide succinyltransferase)
MAKFEIIMPKLGESIIEATITKWLKDVGDTVEEDDALAEIATDKVDSEIPSPVEGTVKELMFQEGDVVAVGKVIAIIDMEGEEEEESEEKQGEKEEEPAGEKPATKPAEPAVESEPASKADFAASERFYSPLVKSISKQENISIEELDRIEGSGKDGRVTKKDVLDYLQNRKAGPSAPAERPAPAAPAAAPTYEQPSVSAETGDEVFEMDRMRKLIADHMVMSKQVSPHVTSFIDVDMTNIVMWRNRVKDEFLKREKQKLTFTPILMEAAAAALKDYPRVNASVDGTNIIHRKNIHMGMATADQ